MADEVLRAENITKIVGNDELKVEILHKINIQAFKGEFLSILGPSGSGKTTLLECLSGLMLPTSGQIQILKNNLYKLSNRKLAMLRRRDISYIFQSYNLLPALPAYDNIVLPLRLAHQKIDRAKVEKLMQELNFKAKLNQFPSQLSGGEQQKIATARALMMNAKIIFADEPTGALDSKSRQILFEQLKDLTRSGVCVIMVTHDIELAARTDRALILHDGEIKYEFKNPSETELFNAISEGSTADVT